MEENISISKLFAERFETLRNEKVEEAERECKKEVLIDLIDAHRNYFPLWVVLEGLSENPRLSVLYCIGKINWSDASEAELFYGHSTSHHFGFDKGTIYKRITPIGAIVPGVEEPSELSDKEREGTLKLLEEAVAKGKMFTEIVAPSGFYVFRFTAQWAVGGYQEDAVTQMRVIKADSLRDAVGVFEKDFRFPGTMQENCFRDFWVYSDGMWREIKPDSGYPSPPFHFSTIEG